MIQIKSNWKQRMDVNGQYQERTWRSANDILVQRWRFEQDPGEPTLFTVF